MIVRYVDRRHLAKVNQIYVRNERGFNNKRVNTKFILSFVFSIVFALLLISLSSDSVTAVSELQNVRNAEFNMRELYSTQDSGRVVRDRNIATAAGAGRIREDTAQGRLLGRRAALTDARRNLLILRQKLLREHGAGVDGRHSVSGKIAGVRIHSERVVNDIYFLQVDVPLDELMEGVIEIE